MQLQLTIPTSTKQCRKCGETKPLAEFSKDRGRPDGLFMWCKTCSRKSVAERSASSEEVRYANNEASRRYKARKRGDLPPHVPTTQYTLPERREQKITKRKRKRVSSKAMLRRIKAYMKCQVCGEPEPIALDFHHMDPSTKSFFLSRIGRDKSVDTLISEIMKCCCLCANCHRKFHFGVITLDGVSTITKEQIDFAMITAGNSNDVVVRYNGR